MVASKFVTVAIPYSYKWATDALAGKLAADAPLPSMLTGAVALTALYGLLRILMALTQQGRDALFAAVAMNAVRRLAIEVFEHLHRLSLRFHLERKTGGLTRVLERGRNAIETIIRTSMLVAVPTIVEFALIVAVLLYSFDWRYVIGDQRHGARLSRLHHDRHQLADRHPPLDERKRHRRQHQGDRQPAQFRDGQVFRRRGARNGALRQVRWRATSASAYALTSRSRCSNAGQAVIFTCGLIAVLAMCVVRRPRGPQYHRRFRAAQPDDAAALPAAQFHGHGLPRHQAGDRRHRDDVRHPRASTRTSRDRPGARAAQGRRRRGAFRERRLRLRLRARRSCAASRSRRRRGTRWRSSARREPESRRFRGCCSASTSRSSGRITIDGQDIAEVTQASPARRDRHGAAGHGAVQRHDPLQHPLRPRRRERGGGRRRRRKTRRSTPSSARCRRVTARRSASAA